MMRAVHGHPERCDVIDHFRSRAGPSLAGRFAAAIALTIGFYVLALALRSG